MPIVVTEGKTPRGARMMRAAVSGHISLADAQGMASYMQPGQPFHQALVLCTVDKSTQYSAESRKFFGTMPGLYKLMATVVTSSILRAAINFMQRMTGSNDLRMFNTEAEGLAWLDEKGGS